MDSSLSQKQEFAQVRWLSEQDVAEITGLSLSTLRKHRVQQIGIRFSKIGRSVRYKLGDILEFMHAHSVEPRR